jgi:hypothetical protein
MIGPQKNFELGLEREMFLKQKAGLEHVHPPCHLFNEGFRQAPALLPLQGTDKAAPGQVGQIIADFGPVLVHKRFHVRLLPIRP